MNMIFLYFHIFGVIMMIFIQCKMVEWNMYQKMKIELGMLDNLMLFSKFSNMEDICFRSRYFIY